jgi:phosphatidylinositol-3-phosphatase
MTTMLRKKLRVARMASSVLTASACFAAYFASSAFAQDSSKQIGTVFYIELENHNWTQPASDTSAPNQIFGCPAAPYINSLVKPNTPNAKEVSYATAYHNVLATPNGNNPSIHPSEPNYLWQEAGSNFGIFDDNDPYAAVGPTVPAIHSFLAANPTYTGEHLTGLMEKIGLTWKAYQEDIDLLDTTGANANFGGTPTSTVAPKSKWTVPLTSLSGISPSYVNEFNGSNQYNFACKHDGTLFFPDTNGGNIPSTTNKKIKHYAPLQQLFKDLQNNQVARYNLITPDQYNEMHSALTSGFVYQGVSYTGDLSQIAAADNFLSIVIPRIMASEAYQANGVIVIWTDETEGTNPNDYNHTLAFIVISKLAKGNAYASSKDYTHSSDLATLQKVFGLRANTPSGYLNDAANPTSDGTTDISDMFKPGVIPKSLPPFSAGKPTAKNYAANK